MLRQLLRPPQLRWLKLSSVTPVTPPSLAGARCRPTAPHSRPRLRWLRALRQPAQLEVARPGFARRQGATGTSSALGPPGAVAAPSVAIACGLPHGSLRRLARPRRGPPRHPRTRPAQRCRCWAPYRPRPGRRRPRRMARYTARAGRCPTSRRRNGTGGLQSQMSTTIRRTLSPTLVRLALAIL